MKKAFFALLSICTIVISCKKDKPDPVDPVADKPYMNTVNGTRWTYRVVTDSGLATQSAVIDTVTIDGDSSINSKVYKILKHTNGGIHSYYNVTANGTANDYYQFQAVAAAGTSIEQLYLKDNLSQNETWAQDVTLTVTGIGDVPVHITYTILEKGTTKVVSGITYNDVIAVKTDLSSTLLPPGTIVSDIKSYYARNIGLIQGDYNVDVAAAGIAIHTDNILQTADLH